MNKNALVTGANGDIGGAFVDEFVARGYHVFGTVRDKTKDNVQRLLHNPSITIAECNIEDPDQAKAYIKSLAEQGIIIHAFALAAGAFMWDEEFPTVDDAVRILTGANFTTKKNIIDGFTEWMPEQKKHMRGVSIGSHASDHPEWQDIEKGYYVSTKLTEDHGHSVEDDFELFLVEKPGLIDTAMARRKFNKNTPLGYDPDWSTALTPKEYVLQVFAKAGW